MSTSTDVGDLKVMLQGIITDIINREDYLSGLSKEGICDTVTPTVTPSMRPSTSPSRVRTLLPSATPSLRPTMRPTSSPSNAPSTMYTFNYNYGFDAIYAITCFEEFIDSKVKTELSNGIHEYDKDPVIDVYTIEHGE